jgi:ABC-type oligopeptide transport system substrate-binding subunit
MSKNLENFIRENRDGFDTASPSSKIWQEIEKEITGNPKKAPVHFMKKKWWAVAAAAVLLITTAAVYIVLQQPNANITVAVKKPIMPVEKNEPHDIDIATIDPGYARQVAQFSGLIEEKQKELQLIQTDQPSLYGKFSNDIKRLDSTYHLLKHELPVNPNKEELLQAMIYNLQLQINLLNQQLNIIQKIKEAKSKTL